MTQVLPPSGQSQAGLSQSHTGPLVSERLCLCGPGRRSDRPVGVRGADQGAAARAGGALPGPLLPLVCVALLVPHAVPQRPALSQRRLRGRLLLLPRHQGHLPAGPGRAGGQRRPAGGQHRRRPGAHDPHQVGLCGASLTGLWWLEIESEKNDCVFFSFLDQVGPKEASCSVPSSPVTLETSSSDGGDEMDLHAVRSTNITDLINESYEVSGTTVSRLSVTLKSLFTPGPSQSGPAEKRLFFFCVFTLSIGLKKGLGSVWSNSAPILTLFSIWSHFCCFFFENFVIVCEQTLLVSSIYNKHGGPNTTEKGKGYLELFVVRMHNSSKTTTRNRTLN